MQILKTPTTGKKTPTFWEKLGQTILPSSAQPAKTVTAGSKSSSSVVGKAGASVGGAAPRTTGTVPGVKGTTFPSTTTTAGAGSSAVPVKAVPAPVTTSAPVSVVDPLYVPNEAQKQEADLVAKLPSEFPIVAWDSLSATMQQKVIEKSGLSPQDQWKLLNASTPLQVLSLLNEIQNNAKSGLLTSSEASKITDQTLRYSDNRIRLVSGDASYLPPLQKALWNRELDKVFGDLQDKTKGDSSGKSKTTPKPSSTPLPKPGPTPEIDADQLKQDFKNIDRSLLSGDSKILFDLTMEQLRTNRITSNVYSTISANYSKLLNESNKIKLLDKVKHDSALQATWDESIINNQALYALRPGSFGSSGNLAKNGCGFVAIHNANQILGISSRFDETYYELNKAGDLATNWSGKLGMNPLTVDTYFLSKGCKVSYYENIDAAPKDHDAYILLYPYLEVTVDKQTKIPHITLGAHYIAVENQSGKLMAYNNDPNDYHTQYGDNFSDFIGSPNTPASLWGIDLPE